MLFTENALFGSAGINLSFGSALLQDFLRCDWPLARYQTSQLVKKMSKVLSGVHGSARSTINVIEDNYQFFYVHMRLSTRCKIWFSLGLFANYFSPKITKPFPQKSHECALKLTVLCNTSLLFDLNYKFINGSLAFSLG